MRARAPMASMPMLLHLIARRSSVSMQLPRPSLASRALPAASVAKEVPHASQATVVAAIAPGCNKEGYCTPDRVCVAVSDPSGRAWAACLPLSGCEGVP